MTYERQRTGEQRFAVLSRKVVLIVCYALAAAAVVALMTDRTALGIGLLVGAAVLILVRGLWTARRGMRVARQRETAQVPAAPVAAAGAPVPLDGVVADLVGMNSDGLPYRIDAARTADGAQVEVRWKSEELRWTTLFVKGSVAYAWRMELTLDQARAHYRFVEYSGTTSISAGWSPGGMFARGDWSWKRGKTAYQTKASFREGADGQIVVADAGGSRASWEGATIIRPVDAKKPVFAVLRQNGWRPRWDWWGARLFEK
ncbi:hypothetical protein Bcav_4048 [Beutenbergia cavernae DSM 12333]|uniref:DUF4178 domain-containing protein n=1 Tax=Beutenbergia cavernae (strain ATCC BAA-8 / DSM 12333 / CCUG 43141 / JCM 11478 / NBRC 16432 / NCIMB 13614 / HKI 0122) TaxID=471853 RepID=C5C5E9_BEUC1|nr:hypothetical protein [Beutenbergia cavernae]ACQ82289.1 hypothetical protein Bcav_4048 [Beutenbergia cavernae DSM 12333]